MQKEVKKSPRHPEALAEGSYEILHYVQNDVVFQQGRTTPTPSFPCLTWESTGCGFNAPRYAQSVQSGRTLVEMLGTLAIMGILSITGIWAYGVAMDKNRANNLIQEAQKRAVIVAGQIGLQGSSPSLAEFNPPNPTSGGTFEGVTTDGLYKQFGIQVSNVSKSICQNILNTIGDTTPIRRLSKTDTSTTPITSCDEENAFLVIYNNDMQGAASDTEYAIDDSSCKSVCGVFNPETHLCDESDCTIPTNTCTANTDCNTENECMVCDTESGLCKNGCERVEYLESTGRQYIDTGITASIYNSYKIKFQYTINSTPGSPLWGDWFPSNSSLLSFASSGNIIRALMGDIILAELPYNTDIHTFSYNGNSKTGEIDNATTGNIATKTSSQSQYLFASSYNNRVGDYGKGRIFYFKVWNNGNLIQDFIPVKSPKGNCMFDKVSKALFCDANNGTFKTNKDVSS